MASTKVSWPMNWSMWSDRTSPTENSRSAPTACRSRFPSAPVGSPGFCGWGLPGSAAWASGERWRGTSGGEPLTWRPAELKTLSTCLRLVQLVFFVTGVALLGLAVYAYLSRAEGPALVVAETELQLD